MNQINNVINDAINVLVDSACNNTKTGKAGFKDMLINGYKSIDKEGEDKRKNNLLLQLFSGSIVNINNELPKKETAVNKASFSDEYKGSAEDFISKELENCNNCIYSGEKYDLANIRKDSSKVVSDINSGSTINDIKQADYSPLIILKNSEGSKNTKKENDEFKGLLNEVKDKSYIIKNGKLDTRLDKDDFARLKELGIESGKNNVEIKELSAEKTSGFINKNEIEKKDENMNLDKSNLPLQNFSGDDVKMELKGDSVKCQEGGVTSVCDTVLEIAKMQSKNKDSEELKVDFSTADFGNINLTIAKEKGIFNLIFNTQDDNVKKLLMQTTQALRETFSDNGLNLGNIQVKNTETFNKSEEPESRKKEEENDSLLNNKEKSTNYRIHKIKQKENEDITITV